MKKLLRSRGLSHAPRNGRRVEFFFDVISPYTYLCWHTLEAYAPRWGFGVEPKPIFLGGVMQATKNTPPTDEPRMRVQDHDADRGAQFDDQDHDADRGAQEDDQHHDVE